VKVEIVVQFFKVGEIDTLKEQFSADVIIKAKWREPTFDGQQSTAVSLTLECHCLLERISISNGLTK